jgi:hypothetical protein
MGSNSILGNKRATVARNDYQATGHTAEVAEGAEPCQSSAHAATPPYPASLDLYLATLGKLHNDKTLNFFAVKETVAQPCLVQTTNHLQQ